MSSQHHLVLNQASGGHQRGLDPHEVGRLVSEAFAAEQKELQVHVVAPREIDDTLRRILATRPRQVIVGGGDGTVASAAGILGGSDTVLGVLPMGTFNLAARDLGVPLEIPDAAKFLARAEPMDIDVLEVNGLTCLCTMVLGFYPQFSETLERRDHGGRWWRKALKLITGLPGFFRRARPMNLHWITPEKTGRVRTKFAAFVPGRYREEIGMVPAREGFQAGTLTAYLGDHHSTTEAMKAALDFMAGRHESNAGLTVVESTSMEIRIPRRRTCKLMIDGEILTLDLPLYLNIRPKHLRILGAPEPRQAT